MHYQKHKNSHLTKILCFTILLIFCITDTVTANPFSNLSKSHWAYKSVNKIVSSGLMENYKNGMFTDNMTITRYQMATIVKNLLSISITKGCSESSKTTLKKLAEEFCPELELLGSESIIAKFNADSDNKIIKCIPDYTCFSSAKSSSNEVGQCRETPIAKISEKSDVKFGGGLMIRPEFTSVGRPATNPGEDSKSVTWYAIRLNALKKLDRVDLFAEIHQYGYFGEREDANPYTLGTMTNNNSNGTNTGFKAFWAKLYLDKENKQTLTIGRQGFRFDLPMHTALCDWRGPGRRFDGILYENKINKDFDLNLFYSKVNQDENWYDKLVVAGIALPEQDADYMGFHLHWNKIINNKFTLLYYEKTMDDLGDININTKSKTKTLGLDWYGKKNNYKYRLHYADQGGYSLNNTLAKTDYNGNMLLLELSYKIAAKNELGVQYTRYSGDDNGTDNTAFQPLFPACHKYLGYADQFLMSNIKDVSFSLKHKATSSLNLEIDFHKFTLDKVSSAPAYYGYGMPTYSRPAHGVANNEDDLGFEWDLTASYKYSKNVTLKFGHSKFSSGDYFTDPQQGGYAFDTNWSFIHSDIKF